MCKRFTSFRYKLVLTVVAQWLEHLFIGSFSRRSLVRILSTVQIQLDRDGGEIFNY